MTAYLQEQRDQQTQQQQLHLHHDYVPYQVDYTHVVVGKHFHYTKRRVRFVFGFASERAMNTGCTGPECRGDEHEVVLVWSWTSGKQLLFLDGQEIMRNVNRNLGTGASKFEHTFFLGKHVVILSGSANVIPAMDPAKQFDLKIDGRSFFAMSKIWELGRTEHSKNDFSSSDVRPYNNYQITESAHQRILESAEERLIQMAKEISLEEIEQKQHEIQKPQTPIQRPSVNASPYTPEPPSIPFHNPFTYKTTSPRQPSFHPREPEIMSFMKPPRKSNGPPQEVHVSPDAPTYKTPTPIKKKFVNDTDEPWEHLVDFASLKGSYDRYDASCDDTVFHQAHDYFDYYKDYDKHKQTAEPMSTSTSSHSNISPPPPPPTPSAPPFPTFNFNAAPPPPPTPPVAVSPATTEYNSNSQNHYHPQHNNHRPINNLKSPLARSMSYFDPYAKNYPEQNNNNSKNNNNNNINNNISQSHPIQNHNTTHTHRSTQNQAYYNYTNQNSYYAQHTNSNAPQPPFHFTNYDHNNNPHGNGYTTTYTNRASPQYPYHGGGGMQATSHYHATF